MAYDKVRETLSKEDCNCAICKAEIQKLSSCIIDPKKKIVYCMVCGKDIK